MCNIPSKQKVIFIYILLFHLDLLHVKVINFINFVKSKLSLARIWTVDPTDWVYEAYDMLMCHHASENSDILMIPYVGCLVFRSPLYRLILKI